MREHADLTFTHGFDYENVLTLSKLGEQQQLDGATIKLHVWMAGASADLFSVTLQVDPATDTARLLVPKTQIVVMAPYGQYRYDIRVMDTAGNLSRPIFGPVWVGAERG